MSANDQITSKVKDYLSLKKMADDLQKELDSLADAIKSYMTENEVDTMTAGSNIVQLQIVNSKRLDTKGLKTLLGDALDPYYNIVTSHRLIIK